MFSVLTDKNFLGAFFQTIIIIAFGFMFQKKGYVNQNGKEAITTIVWKLAIPCMAFNAFMTDIDYPKFISSVTVLIVTIVLYALFLVIGLLLFKRYGKKKAKVCALTFVIGQVTLFSMPILNSIYGGQDGDVMISIDIMTIAFRLMLYIVAFFMISGLEFTGENFSKSLKKIMLNPIMICMFAGMLIWAVQNFLPQVNIDGKDYAFLRIDKTIPAFYTVVTTLEKLVSPLAMFLIGMTLGEANIRDIFSGKLVWITAFLRTVAAPFITLGFALLLNETGFITLSSDAIIALTIGFSAPASVSFNLFCVQFKCEEHLASSICVLSTLMCIITIPLVYAVTLSLV